ncbi:glycosyltransferase family 2 protein [Nostoc sp. FACHB-110]|uniref:glycosyltransferase family 2 protein n=1 Tax=Nostoc sp. FACHB-110 TaxID=2692834 RepID=UPI001684640E|nr:glycosyltransferase family 2 protein [Nostoc sp. FACHB-110]MBD2435782.1 glycosyltransferase family 2 protein [Nostoc sp. FACHB-110]
MSEPLKNLVSAVIPTRNRPSIAIKAVKSALAQTIQSIEVIVVVDGPDEATVKELHQIEDPRLRVIALPKNIGPSGARNVGIREAKGNWIAFLDDDDAWLPEKIERQLEAAYKSNYTFPIVSCRFFAQTSKGELIWPKRLPHSSEPISEYLFVRSSLFLGETFISTSTILTKKELLEKIPLDEKLHRHEDFDWLVKVSLIEGVGVEFVSEPLVNFNAMYTPNRKSLSNINNWQYSLDWIHSVRDLVTPLAYSAFVTTVVSSQAATEQNYQAFVPLLWDAVKFGRPRALDILLYLAMWLIPKNLRQVLRYFMNKNTQKPA